MAPAHPEDEERNDLEKGREMGESGEQRQSKMDILYTVTDRPPVVLLLILALQVRHGDCVHPAVHPAVHPGPAGKER